MGRRRGRDACQMGTVGAGVDSEQGAKGAADHGAQEALLVPNLQSPER